MHRYVLQPPVGEPRTVEVRDEEIRVGEERLRAHVVPRGAGHVRLYLEGRVVDCHFARAERTLYVWLEGRTWEFRLADHAASFGPAASAPADHVASPMPGTVRKILVAVGDHVEADARVVIMESMKMEVSLVAPRAGRVAEVACAEGALVDLGQVLVRLEAE